jgi:hypothetical protein
MKPQRYESMSFAHKKDSTRKREAFFIEFAERIRPNLKTAKLAVTGGFRSLDGCVLLITVLCALLKLSPV